MTAALLAALICTATTVAPVMLIARRQGHERTFFVALGRRVNAVDRAWESGVRTFAIAATVTAVVVVLFGGERYAPVAILLATLAPMIALGIGTLRAVFTSYAPAPAGRFTVPLHEPFSSTDLASAFWQVANLALIISTSAAFLWLLPLLPDRIPVRLDFYGRPVNWGSPEELWGLGAIMVFITVTMWVSFVALARERVALSPEEPDAHLELHRARRLLLARMLELTMVGVNVTLASVWLGLCTIGLPDFHVPPMLVACVINLATLFTVVGPMAYFIPRLIRVQDALRALGGSEVLGTRARGWRFGGLIYFAPDDPALFVPKKVGLGQTLNMARPAAWLILGSLIATPILIGWLATACRSAPPPPRASPSARTAPRTEPIVFTSGAMTLKGTLHLPHEGEGPHPAVVLIHGSGPQSRKVSVRGQLNMGFGFELEVFRQLAEQLAERGIAVLSYDKRSCGPFNKCASNDYPVPTGSITIDTFIDDARAAADHLRKRADIDADRVTVVGHSQGASFVPVLLDVVPELHSGVMLAAAHKPVDGLIADQLGFTRKLLEQRRLPARDIDRSLAPLTKVVDQLKAVRAGTYDGKTIGGASAEFWRSWMALADRARALATTAKRPLLVIGGTYDWNVPPAETESWRATLAKSDRPDQHRVEILKCVTHALNCVAQPDYRRIRPDDIGRSVHGEVTDRIATFLGR